MSCGLGERGVELLEKKEVEVDPDGETGAGEVGFEAEFGCRSEAVGDE